jgi:hypothetical protein
MFEFKSRTHLSQKIDTMMINIDSNTPLSSIIFTNITNISRTDSIPAFGHRLTFKSKDQFSMVDKQYTSDSFLENTCNFSNISEICNYLRFSNSKEDNSILKRPLYFVDSNSLQRFRCLI